jgi:hypothetical protein
MQRAHKEYTRQTYNDLSWFLGFVEGRIGLQINRRREEGFVILIQKDVRALLKIRKILGFGEIIVGRNYSKYIIKYDKAMLNIFRMFSGNLFLEKTRKSFRECLYLYNKKEYPVDPFNENKFIYSFLSHSWLAGFIDAVGCIFFKRGPSFKNFSSCGFVITFEAENVLFFHLAAFLNTQVIILQNPFDLNMHHHRIWISKVSLKKFLLYLDNFGSYNVEVFFLKRLLKILYRIIDNRDHSSVKAQKKYLRLLYYFA